MLKGLSDKVMPIGILRYWSKNLHLVVTSAQAWAQIYATIYQGALYLETLVSMLYGSIWATLRLVWIFHFV